MFIIYLSSDIFLTSYIVLVFIPYNSNCRNIYFYFSFLEVKSSGFWSLVPFLMFLYEKSPRKQVTKVSLVLKDSDMVRNQKQQLVDMAFCIKWPENRQLKRCIIYILCKINLAIVLYG